MAPIKSRKLPHEYSTNPNTIRARRRKAALSPYAKEVEQAKASDSKSVTRAWKTRAATVGYEEATPEERKRILETVERDVMDRRRRQGLDAESKIGRFMQRQASVVPKEDDNEEAKSNADIASMPPPPLPLPKVPVAQMHTPQSQQSHGHRFVTPSSFLPYPVPSIERNRGFSEMREDVLAVPSPQFNYFNTDNSGVKSNMQVEIASFATRNASLTRDLQEAQRRHHESEKRASQLDRLVEQLSNDLVIAKARIVAQDVRLEAMNSRMNDYDDTAVSLRVAEASFHSEAEKLRRVIQGVQMLATVANQVSDELSTGSGGGGVAAENQSCGSRDGSMRGDVSENGDSMVTK